MKVKCSSCGSANNVADDRVRGRRVKVRCKSCGTRLVVDATEDGTARAVAASDAAKGPASPSMPPGKVSPLDAKPSPLASRSPLGRTIPLGSKPPPAAKPTSLPARTAPGVGGRMPTPMGARRAPPPPVGGRPLPAPAGKSSPKPPPPKTQAQEEWWVNLDESDEQSMTVAQIVSGWTSGTITDDAYVWRDGMEDWLPVLEVPSLKAAIDASGKGGTPSKPPSVRLGSPLGAGAAPQGAPAPAAFEQADMFVDVEIAGSELDATTGSADQAASERVSGPPASETSAQMSLQALKAGMQPAPEGRKRQPSAEDMMGMGGAGGPGQMAELGTADLATAPAPPEPEPEPPPPPPPELEPAFAQPTVAPARPFGLLAMGFIVAMFFAMVASALGVALWMKSSQDDSEDGKAKAEESSGDEKDDDKKSDDEDEDERTAKKDKKSDDEEDESKDEDQEDKDKDAKDKVVKGPKVAAVGQRRRTSGGKDKGRDKDKDEGED